MDNREILHAVVEADRAARERLDAARRRQKTLALGAEEIRAAEEEKAMSRAKTELEMSRQRAQLAAQKDMEQTQDRLNEERQRLEKQYAAVKDECVEKIFKAAVGLS